MNADHSFDLLEQEWIPVVWLDGKAGMVGIRQGIGKAHEIKCISHTSPFIEFGLYRLLITIVLDAYIMAGRRPTIWKLKELLASKRFDHKVVMGYLDDFAGGFDLWAAEKPFLQVAMASDQKQPSPVEKMIAPIPSGTKITFWHHFGAGDAKGKGETELTGWEAAQELTAVMPFCFDYAPSDVCTIAGDPPLYVVVQGHNLFETIVLNLPRPNGRHSTKAEKEGGPSWRCPVANASEVPRSPTHAQAWTWPVRQIRLNQPDERHITTATNIAGAGKTATKERVRSWRDPSAGTITDANGLKHIRGRDGMLLWRDLVPLYLVGSEGEVLRGERRRSRPEVVTNALRITDGEMFRLVVYGFIDKGGKNNKVFRAWVRSTLSFPTEVARDRRLSSQAQDAFKQTQKVADALAAALRMLKPPVKASKDKRPIPGRGDADILVGFWQAIEPVLAHTYLEGLGKNNATYRQDLYIQVKKQALIAFNLGCLPQRRTADGLFRMANASNWLERRLARIVPVAKDTNS